MWILLNKCKHFLFYVPHYQQSLRNSIQWVFKSKRKPRSVPILTAFIKFMPQGKVLKRPIAALSIHIQPKRRVLWGNFYPGTRDRFVLNKKVSLRRPVPLSVIDSRNSQDSLNPRVHDGKLAEFPWIAMRKAVKWVWEWKSRRAGTSGEI